MRDTPENPVKSAHYLATLLSTVATACFIAPVSMAAQQTAASRGFEEIVVMARQREERLADVPATITAFSNAEIENAGIQRPEDFVRLTPGVIMTNNVEVGDFSVSIRGINKARDGESNFAFIVDGILLTNPTAFNREFDDLSQIVVMKGPQGALYGRSAIAGAIIVDTERPTNEFEAGGRLTVGNNSTYSGSAFISGPLVDEQLFARLSASYRTTDGTFKNSFRPDTRVDDLENYSVRGRFIWEPSADLKLDAKLNYSEVPEAGGVWFNQSFGFFEDVNDHEFVYFHNVNPLNEQKTFEASLKADYDMDWATLTVWGLYSKIDNFVFADGTFAGSYTFATEPTCIASTAELFADGVTLPPPSFLGPTPFDSALLPLYGPTTCDGYQTQTVEQDDISFEFRLTSPSDQTLRWQVGMYYLDIQREYGLSQGIDNGDDQVVRDLLVPGRTETLIHSDFDTEVISGFGHVFYDVAPDLELAVALRWDREKRKIHSLVPPPSVYPTQYVDFVLPIVAGAGGSPLNPAFGFVDGEIVNSVPDRDATFKHFQPKVSLRWQPQDNLTLFSSWGVGFKSGGFNATGIAEIIDLFINVPIGSQVIQVNDLFRKEVTNAFEAGFKSSLADGRVNLEGSLFYTIVDDMQFFEFLTGPFGVIRAVSNIDKVHIKGLEAGFDAQLDEMFSIYGGASVIDGKIKRHDGRPISVGNEVPYAPKWTANIGVQAIIPTPVDGLDFFSRVDWAWVGPTWFHVIQAQSTTTVFGTQQDYTNTRRDTYNTVNLRAGVQGENWSLIGYAQNLFNEKYLDEVIPLPELGGSNLSPGLRRAYGAELRYRF